MRQFSWALLLPLLAVGCTRSEVDFPDGQAPYDPSRHIVATTSVASFSGAPATRGALTASIDDMADVGFGFFCAYTGARNWDPSDNLDVMFNAQMVQGSGDRNHYSYWQYATGQTAATWKTGSGTSADDRYTFFAYAPYVEQGATNDYNLSLLTPAQVTAVYGSDRVGVPHLAYEVPTDNTKQPDLMVSAARANIRPTGNPVSLQMQHALTAVGFRIYGNGEQLTQISLYGIYVQGILPLNGNWDYRTVDAGGTPTDAVRTTAANPYLAGLAFDSSSVNYCTLGTSGNVLKDDGWLMMIPQGLVEDTTMLKLDFADGTSELINLSKNHSEWGRGKRVIYTITIVPGGTITVMPETLTLPYMGVDAETDNIQVTCEDGDGNDTALAWTLSTADTWLQLGLQTDGSDKTQTLSGSGSQTVYTFADPNSLSTARTTTVSLGSGVVVNVTQLKPVTWPVLHDPPTSVDTYVGAFWTKAQTGERLIRIPVGANTANTGPWSAHVAFWGEDNDFAETDIVLALGGSADTGVGTESPGDAETYPVTGTTTAVAGDAEAGGVIEFRIGLKSAYTGSKPARYAGIIVSYNNYNRHQLILLRQGEGDDYLMKPGEVGTNNAPTRPLARKVAVYNLTAPAWKAPNAADSTTPSIDVGSQGGVWTDYPTQGGAHFRWAHTDGVYAYNPVSSLNASPWSVTDYITGAWTSTAPNSPGKTIGKYYDACPSGYHRPSNGTTSDLLPIATALAVDSEIAQSLWSTPKGSDTNDVTHTIWGSYADGFFDRRVSGNGDVASRGNSAVAYRGSLFFNPNSYNSVFLPAAGMRNYNSPGAMTNAGSQGYYWLANVSSTTTAWYTNLANGTAVRNTNSRRYGYSVRCVVDDPLAYPPDLEAPSTGAIWQ